MSDQCTSGVTRSPAREVHWVPVVIAAGVIVPLLALSVLPRLLAVAVIAGGFAPPAPPGVTDLKPSGWDLTIGLLNIVAPAIAGLLLLVLTSIFAVRGWRGASWICAAAACVVSMGTVLHDYV